MPNSFEESARRVTAQNAYGSIYSSQYADVMKSAQANEMANRLGIAPDIIEADFPNMMAEDRLRKRIEETRRNSAYARIMANPRLAAAAIDDDELPKVAEKVGALVVSPRPRSFMTGLLEGATYLDAGFKSGLYSAASLLGDAAESFNPFSAAQRGVRQIRGIGDTLMNGREGFIRSQADQARSTPLTRFSENMTRASRAVDVPMPGYSDLEYATTDTSKSALLSPVRIVHDALQSLPTTAALLGTVILTRGAAARAEATALAQGISPQVAKQIGVKAAVKMATVSGAVGEGTVGGLQQGISTRTEVLDMESVADSRYFKALVKAGISPDDAQQYIATQAGSMAGLDAAVVDAGTNIVGGRFLGKIIGEGGSLLKRMGKGFINEAGVEAVQSGGEQLTANAAIQEYADPHRALIDNVVESVIAGAAVGGFTGGAFASVFARNNRNDHDLASARAVDSIMESAAASPTRTANPTQFTEALNQLVGDTAAENIYVPAEQVQALFQSEDGPAKDITADPFWSKYAQQLQEASALGGDVIIPLADIATHLAGTPQWASLRDHVRTSPQGASITEAKERQTPEELEKMAGEIAKSLEGQVRSVAQREAMQTVSKLAQGLGYTGERATAINRYLASWLAVQHPAEVAKSLAAGETPPTLQEFAAAKLPDKVKMAQADYEAAQADAIDNPERAAAQVSETSEQGAQRRAPRFLLEHWEWARSRGDKPKAVWAIKRADGVIRTWAASRSSKPLEGKVRDGETLVKVKPDEQIIVPDEALNQDVLDDGARGNISIERDEAGFMSAALIRAFESANFSTAIHELGHFFLEDLRTRALRGDATDQERADWEAFKTWALDDLDGLLVADDSLIPTEAHEFFARGMERYVWEGQAPSKPLRGLFARMREFMLELYRTATAFNAPLTPEIREVMDRMLASEAEIAEQRAEMKIASEAIGGLLSPDEKREYDLLADEARLDAKDKLFERILSALRAEKRTEYNERKREFKAEAEEAIDGQPIMVALKLLRTGLKDADGNTNNVRLSREWLIDTYGEGIVAELPKGVPPIIGDTDTMDADQIAEMAGYSSGDAMVKNLIEHEAARQEMKAGGDKRSPRSKAIADIVDARIRDEIGDPYADLEEEAKAALASDKQADAMSMELRAIARKTSRKPTPWKLAVEWAKERVSTQTAKEALSGTMLQMYARNAAKAGQAVEEALIAQDFAEAFQAKQRQMLNMALLQEARKAKETVDKAVRRMQKIASKATIRSVDQDYLDQAHQLLEDVDLKTRPQTRIDKRLAFEAWHSNQVAMGVEPVVPPEYRSLLGRTNWSRLPIDELLELDQTVGQIVELGRLKQKLRDNKAERDYEEGVAELIDVGGRQPPRDVGTDLDPSRSLGGKIKSRIRGVDAAMIKVEQLVDWLDGNDSNGPFNRLIFGVMAEAQGRENDLMRDYVERINGLIKTLPSKQVKGWDRKVDTPELTINIRDHPQRGRPFQFTKDQVVMLAMNWGNAGNRQRLLDGFGWSEDQVASVLDRLMTKEDWDFVQGVWDTVDSLWPEIEQLERRVNGVAPDKIEAVEVVTAHGVYKGGYFPAVYDPTYSSRVELDEASKLSPNGAWHQATTRSSASKARSAMVKDRPLLLSMSVITRHLGEVIHDVTHREAVGQVRKLLADTRVRSVVSSRMGPEYLKRMGSWMENIATPNASNSKSDPSMVAIARHLNKGVSLVGLGFRLSSALVQPLGMSNMVAIVGEKAVANGIATATAHPIATYREVMSRSAEMRSRFSTMDSSIEDMAADAASGKLKTLGPRGLVKHAFDGILYMDMLITTAGWIGAFNKGLSEGMAEDDAGYYADKVIRTSQGAGGAKDRSAILYENQFARSFWPFFSYLNALYNQQRDVGRRVRNAESAKEYLEAGRRAWWIVIVPAVLQALIFGEGPDEDDEEGWAGYLTKAVMFGNVGSLPGIGPIVNAIGTGYGYRSNAWQGIGEDIKKSWDELDKEDPEIKGSSIKRVMSIAGIVLAKPLGQIGATSQGIYDYARGEAEPEDAGDWYELITKGKVTDEPRAIERLMGEES